MAQHLAISPSMLIDPFSIPGKFVVYSEEPVITDTELNKEEDKGNYAIASYYCWAKQFPTSQKMVVLDGHVYACYDDTVYEL